MKTYKITYFMYPHKDIETYFTAKDEDEAIAFAKKFRNDPFSVEKYEADKHVKVTEITEVTK